MKRTLQGMVAGILLLVGMTGVAAASPNDFHFTSFDADYYLGSDSEGRSTLRTVEKLTAEFPDYDQNHGIERAIPRSYDGHTTSLHIESVTDSSGNKRDYHTYESGGNEVLRIGDADTYVHGTQTYVISYTQRDVTKYFADTKDDEFYWDINGTQWAQAFGNVTARIHLSNSITPTFTKKIACYQGAEGSTEPCEIAASGNVITAHATELGPYENMTVAIGFTLGTFRGYEPSFWERFLGVWLVSLVVTSLIGFIAIFWLSFRYYAASNRKSELHPVPVEYIPPKGISVLVAAQIGDDARAATTAQIIDLAVRHYITIAQVSEKGMWRKAEYELEIVKPLDTLLAEEKEFVQTLFGSEAVGTKLQTKTLNNNYALSRHLSQNTIKLTKAVKGEYGLRDKDPAASKVFYRASKLLFIASILTISPLLLIAAIVAAISGYSLRPLTDKGLELRRYLAGLKQYIELAEKDRIKALQSPEGAEKTGTKIKDGSDKKIVRLYERVLPYAVLFGQEKQWNEQLAMRYENADMSPDWYVGHSVFNAAAFTSAMNDFSTSMNSYSTATSSSSGGSSGGGSSGGGGGGGGGGGW